MAGLGETTARLVRSKRQGARRPGPGAGGRLKETADFGPNPGALRMLSYAGKDRPAAAALVVVLHGCTQAAESHAASAGWLTLADRLGLVVIAPEQSAANNPNRCFNWFNPQDTARGGGEAASIRAMIAHAVRHEGVDPERIYVTGLSAGGAMALVMLAAYPEVFAGGAVVAGLPYGAAANVQEAFAAMQGSSGRSLDALAAHLRRAAPAGRRSPRLTIWHGSADATVRHANALTIAGQWALAHGLPREPTETRSLPGRTRATWRAAGSDVATIEVNIVAGLGHGTPLATGGEKGLGSTGPFMLEAGVSSSDEIVAFWGLAAGVEARSAAEAEPAARLPAPEPEPAVSNDAPPSLGTTVLSSVSNHVSTEVYDVISTALRQAGLMR